MWYRRIFLIGTLALVVFYSFTLGHGFYNDDFNSMRQTLRQWLYNPFALHGRPISTLSYVLRNMVSTSSYWQHAVNVMLFGVLGVLCAWLIRKEGIPPIAYLFSLAALSHPAMVWPVSWIGQGVDLLLLVFTILAVHWYSARSGFVWVLLSCWSKAPFVFQGLVFAYVYLRRKRLIYAGMVTLGCLVSLFFAWQSYYCGVATSKDAHGLFLVNRSGLMDVLMIMVLRGIKILEGIFYKELQRK